MASAGKKSQVNQIEYITKVFQITIFTVAVKHHTLLLQTCIGVNDEQIGSNSLELEEDLGV